MRSPGHSRTHESVVFKVALRVLPGGRRIASLEQAAKDS